MFYILLSFLSLPPNLSLYLSVPLSFLCLSVCLSLSLSLFLSVYLSVSLCVSLTVSLFPCLCHSLLSPLSISLFFWYTFSIPSLYRQHYLHVYAMSVINLPVFIILTLHWYGIWQSWFYLSLERRVFALHVIDTIHATQSMATCIWVMRGMCCGREGEMGRGCEKMSDCIDWCKREMGMLSALCRLYCSAMDRSVNWMWLGWREEREKGTDRKGRMEEEKERQKRW